MPIYNTYWEIHRKKSSWSSNRPNYAQFNKVLCLDKHKFGEKTLNLGVPIANSFNMLDLEHGS
jgi:hypothetical protein